MRLMRIIKACEWLKVSGSSEKIVLSVKSLVGKYEKLKQCAFQFLNVI